MNKKKIIFAASSGGHLTQILQLESLFNKYNYTIITEKNSITNKLNEKYNIKYLFYTSRKKIFHFLLFFPIDIVLSLVYFLKIKPDIIITTGAGTMMPLCMFAKIFKKKIIFIESFARINDLSLSGKLFYNKADYFLVQWPQLKQKYNKSLYFGKIY